FRIVREQEAGKLNFKKSSLREFNDLKSEYISLADVVQSSTEFSRAIEKGNYDAPFELNGKQDKLGNALISMRDALKNMKEVEERNRWISEGTAKFSTILRDTHASLEELSDRLLSELVNYLGINQGGLFIAEQKHGETVLRMVSCYAYERRKFLKKTIKPGEGLAGQVFLEKESIYLTDIPNDYIHITSGLGGALPSAVLIVPLVHDEKVFGVMELASFKAFAQHHIDFSEKLAELFASTVSVVNINEQTKSLLESSQLQSEELRSQEEELRQHLEELAATQEEMQRNQRQVAENENYLSALIDNMEGTLFAYDTDFRVKIVNNALQKRFEQRGWKCEIDDRIHDFLPEEFWQVWKPNYERTLAGETFTLRGEAYDEKGELSVNESLCYPIKDNKGSIIGGVAFSRVVTERIKMENRINELTAVLGEVFSHSDESFLILDRKMNVLFANEKYAETAALNGKEVHPGMNALELFEGVAPEEKEFWLSTFQSVLDGGEKEVRFMKEANGELAEAVCYCCPVRDAEGMIWGAGITSDRSFSSDPEVVTAPESVG
ncbi:MAG: GAF domain-containing protein, partial [Cytophagales bacterium]|nr:GAF domain-containing protein [Cytophagales bacterium]